MSTETLERFECYGCKAEFGVDRLETHNGFSLCRECYSNAPASGIAEIATGEIIASLTPEQAREITDRLRSALTDVGELVAEAWKGQAWAALGYASWDNYVDAEFGSSRLRLPIEERRSVVLFLRGAGMSTRAIAAATGVSDGTVRNDLAGAQDYAPDDLAAEDPEDRPSVEPGSDAPESATSTDSGAPQDQEIKVTATIKGRDGKTYPANTRKPLDPGTIAQIKLLVAAGKTTAEICEATGRGRGSIEHAMKRHGLKSQARKSPTAAAERADKAREMAAEGYTSAQIGQAIGVKDMADFRKRYGIEVPADAAVGRNSQSIDSNRVVSETVATLEGVVMSIGLVGDPATADLDPDQIDDWATSLSNSLRQLNRFSKQLKEMTQ